MPAAYPQEFKDAMVAKMLGPQALSATALARQSGVSQSALSNWRRKALAAQGAPMTSSSSPSPAQILDLLIQARALSGSDLGAFLRTHGLHEADLDAWQQQLTQMLDPAPARQREREHARALALSSERERALEKELRRKDAALAETAALLVLQKKVRQIWGDEDESTPETSASSSLGSLKKP